MNTKFTSLLALGLIACLFPQDRVYTRVYDDAALRRMIEDPSFEVLPVLGCGDARGQLIAETSDTLVYMDIEAQELEEEPQVLEGGKQLQKVASATEPYKTQLVENVIRWQVHVNEFSWEVEEMVWAEDAVDTEVQYKLRDLECLGHGQALVLGETAKGESLFESWVLEGVFGPKLPKDRWVPVGRFKRMLWLTNSYDIDLRNTASDPGPSVGRKVVFQEDLGGLPVAMDAYLPGGLLFVLNRDSKSKATTLWKLEPRKAWAKEVLVTSTHLPMLAASVEVEVFPVGDSTGYLLAVWGGGFGKQTPEGFQSKHVREALCFEDLNGDGTFEAEQVFKDMRALRKYHAQLRAQ
ncbi:MAG: hypothetical protein ACI87O_003022 [Planctomycetota bacterium]|jgi:hypothetical protein